MERKKIIIIILVLAGLAVVFLPGQIKLIKLKRSNENLKKRISLLEENNTLLTEEIRKMEEDPEYIEIKARDKLGIVKEGEYIYTKEKE